MAACTASVPFNVAAPPCNAFPIPYPVKPANKPFLRSPVTAYCAKPEPKAPAAKEDKPAPATPAPPKPVNNALPPNEPSIGAKKGKKASGCPVSGFIVKGTCCAMAFTSIGLTCINIESP